MTQPTRASFLLPEGFRRPPVVAVLRESSVLGEVGRHVLSRRAGERARRAAPYAARAVPRTGDPVLLVPGFLAGDASLALMGRMLRQEGLRTYRSRIRANVGCTQSVSSALEARLEAIALRRGSRVQVVGHSLGGMLARGLAARRPDLVSGIVTLGSPVLAPAAHHLVLGASLEVLVRLSRAGVPWLMAAECVGGTCARASFEGIRVALPDNVGFTAVYSRRDGIVDWRACLDPAAQHVEVGASHLGMALDPQVRRHVLDAVRRQSDGSVLEVDRGVSA